MKIIIKAFLFLTITIIQGQTLSSARSVDWKNVGLQTTDISASFQSINMEDFNVVGDGVTPNDGFLNNALSSITGTGAILKFPEGTFLFNNTITLSSNTVIKGVRPDKTILKMDLSGSGHSIKATGTVTSTSTNLSVVATKDNNFIDVLDASSYSAGDWIQITQTDTDLVTSTWAYGSVGQVVKISSVVGNKITLVSPLRLTYPLSRTPQIKKINPVEHVGIECIKLLRVDDTAPSQTSNIFFEYAVNSWVKGVASENCTFSHIDIRRGANMYVSQSYFHHAFGYGGGGRGYGVVLQATTNECLIENNSFEHLRHSMLLQSGANGNVFAYNYSTDPFWDSTPSNSTGEITLHGNYPYANLFEQNICRNIVIDNSHGTNGPYNTFFRNRADGYGIFFSASNSPSQNFLGNDITNTSFPYFLANYRISGADHFIHGNNNKGTITPAGTSILPDDSYTYTTKPDFVPTNQWAKVGTPNSPSAASIPARDRFVSNDNFKDCCTINSTLDISNFTTSNFHVYNSNKELIFLGLPKGEIIITIYDVLGKKVLKESIRDRKTSISVAQLQEGIYVVDVKTKKERVSKKILIK